MKKRILMIFLSVCVIVSLMPAVAMAATAATVTVGGEKLTYVDTPIYATTDNSGAVTVEGANESNYNIKFEAGVLTLKGATIVNSDNNAIYTAGGDLRVVLTGGTVNKVTSNASSEFWNCGIRLTSGNLTISGDGTLNAMGGTGYTSHGISVSGNVIVESGVVNATTQAAKGCSGIYATSLKINSGKVTAIGSTATEGISYGVEASVNISGGTFIAKTTSGNVNRAAIESAPTIESADEAYVWRTSASAEYTNSANTAYEWTNTQTYVEIIKLNQIDISAVSGVTAPAAGNAPVAAITECSQYTGEVTWSENPETFDYEKSYTATITLAAKEGYSLDGVAEDFFTVDGATSVSYNPETGVITAVFPATAAKDDGAGTGTGDGTGTGNENAKPPSGNTSTVKSVASTTPETGDTTSVELMIFAMLGCGAALSATIYRSKKSK